MKVTEQKPTNQPHKQTKKQMKIEKYSPWILSKTKLGSFVIQIIVGNVTGTCISVARLILFSKKCIKYKNFEDESARIIVGNLCPTYWFLMNYVNIKLIPKYCK